MDGPEFVVIVVTIICATSLIKAWINKQHSMVDEESLNRLARIFKKHIKEMQRRIHNLETIVGNAEEDKENHYHQIDTAERKNTLNQDLQQTDKVRS